MGEYMILMRFLIFIVIAIGIVWLIVREVKSIKTKETQKEALNEAISHIDDTINIGEKLQDIDVERLRKAQDRINAVLTVNKQSKGKV